MWFLNNSLHNPAQVGVIETDMRAFGNFKYQYFTVSDMPNRGISASVEGRIPFVKNQGHHLGVGVNFFNDLTSNSKYTVNEISLPVSMQIAINDESSLSVGVAPSLYNRNLRSKSYTWEHQWTGIKFDETIPGENLGRSRNENTFDISLGLLYRYQSSITNHFSFGFSTQNVIEQDIGFTIEDKLERRFIGQFGLSHRLKNRDWGLSPNVYTMLQGENMNIIFGTNVDFYIIDGSTKTTFISPNSFSFGIYHRLFEGVIVNAILKFRGATIAVAYDSNINGMISHSKSVGGFEIAVAYDFLLNKRRKFIY